MIGFHIHNVTEIKKARVSSSDHRDKDDKSGWIVLNVIAENYDWVDEDQDQIPSEITLYCKNVELAIAQLQEQLDLAIKKDRREIVEKAQAAEVLLKDLTDVANAKEADEAKKNCLQGGGANG